MGWTDFVPGLDTVGEALGGAKKALGLKEDFDKVKEQFDKTRDKEGPDSKNENSADLLEKMEVSGRLELVESALKDDFREVPLVDNPYGKSAVVEFLEDGLNALGYKVESIDGVADPDLIAELNGLIVNIKAVNQDNMFADDFDDLKPIQDISELTGRHLQAVISALSDAADPVVLGGDTPERLALLGQALREADGGSGLLSSHANAFDPDNAPKEATTDLRSSLEDPDPEMVVAGIGMGS